MTFDPQEQPNYEPAPKGALDSIGQMITMLQNIGGQMDVMN